MVQLTRIYTKSGDKGKTALGDGTRLFKDDLRFSVIGDIDEINASLGVAQLYTSQNIADIITCLQNDLFDLGADLCMPTGEGALRIIETQTKTLEHLIDEFNAHLSPLNSFVLPGGSKASAYLHLARTITRRAERSLVALNKRDTLNPFALIYLNRLSDLLFVLCRFENNSGKDDILWIPGKNRETLLKRRRNP